MQRSTEPVPRDAGERRGPRLPLNRESPFSTSSSIKRAWLTSGSTAKCGGAAATALMNLGKQVAAESSSKPKRSAPRTAPNVVVFRDRAVSTASILCASSRIVSPSILKAARRAERSNNAAPSNDSSSSIRFDNHDCEMKSRSAAIAKLPSLAAQ